MFANAGKVYVFQGEDGLVKVGCSKNVKFREHTIQTISGRRIINVWNTEDCSNYRFVEKQAHNSLKNYRTIGEWFNCDFSLAKETVQNSFCSYAEFEFQTKDELDEQAKAAADYFARVFLPEYYEEKNPSEKLDFDKWTPSKEDEEEILKFLRDWYEGTLETADEEAAQEYIDLYNKVKENGIFACKDEIQDTICEIFWAVDGEIEEYYSGDEDLLKIMNLTILKEPVSI